MHTLITDMEINCELLIEHECNIQSYRRISSLNYVLNIFNLKVTWLHQKKAKRLPYVNYPFSVLKGEVLPTIAAKAFIALMLWYDDYELV